MSDLELPMSNLNVGNGEGVEQGALREQRSQRFAVPTVYENSMPASNLPISASSYPSLQSKPLSETSHSEPFYSFNRKPPTERQDSNTYSEDSYGSSSAPYSHQNQQQQSSAPFSSPYNSVSSAYSGGSGFGSTSSTYSTPATSFQRSRMGEPRSGLPNEWMSRGSNATGNTSGYEYRGPQGGYAALVGRPAADDDIIPTAIVIKNIHFSVPKEALLRIMEDLRLPPPFAFNYHFDNGQFRGLAFANFRAASDAALTVSALNGFDLQGRKLRTEFKKVLQEGEKERIERDKALKRMRSQRELSESSLNSGPPIGTWSRREASAPGTYGTPAGTGAGAGEEEDYGRLVQGQFSSGFGGNARSSTREYVPASEVFARGNTMGMGMGSVGMGNANGNGTMCANGQRYSGSPESDVGTSVSARMTKDGSSHSMSGSDGSRFELDLNDPQALEIYSRVLIFKDDSLRDELAFARSLSTVQRRNVHLVAKKLGLVHRSVGEGDDRHVIVFKGGNGKGLVSNAPEVNRSLRHSSSTLGRHTSRDSNSYIHADATPRLSAKKSMPDMRRSNHVGYASSTSNGSNYRDGYVGGGGRGGLPPMPSMNFGTNGIVRGGGVNGLFQQSNFFEPGTNASNTNLSSRNSMIALNSPSPSVLPPAILMTGENSMEMEGTGQGLAVRQPRGPDQEDRGFGRSPASGPGGGSEVTGGGE